MISRTASDASFILVGQDQDASQDLAASRLTESELLVDKSNVETPRAEVDRPVRFALLVPREYLVIQTQLSSHNPNHPQRDPQHRRLSLRSRTTGRPPERAAGCIPMDAIL